MAITLAEAIRGLEKRAPSGTAESWDNVGLLVGDPSWKTAGAVVSVDLNREAIARAKRLGYRLIVNHHPCIFPRSKGISRVLGGEGSGKTGLIFEAIQEGIGVAAYHTNFDRCALEVIESVCEGFKGLVPMGRLFDHSRGTLVKLSVFVPDSHADQVRQALGEAGAGHIGGYDFCSFSSEGDGRFRGTAGTRPFIGKLGQIERVREARIETVFPRGMETGVLRALRAAHPYEEIAYDLFPVEQAPATKGLALGIGYGFWGEFQRPKPFSEIAKGVKNTFHVNGFFLTDPAPRRIKRLGFAAGKGASVVESAAAMGCDLLITGEAGYHEALGASKHRAPKPMAVMELGHRESERFFVPTMSSWLAAMGLKTVGVAGRVQKVYRV